MADKVDCPFCKREIATYQRYVWTPRGRESEVLIRIHNNPDPKYRCPGSQKRIEDH